MTVGGDALNEATILAKHGKSVYLETVLGNDDVGNYLCSHYARHGIELSEAVVKASYMTGINVVLVQKNGERNFLTNRNGSLRKMMISDINMPFPEETKIVCFASVFVCLEIRAKEQEIIFRKCKEAAEDLVCRYDKEKGK